MKTIFLGVFSVLNREQGVVCGGSCSEFRAPKGDETRTIRTLSHRRYIEHFRAASAAAIGSLIPTFTGKCSICPAKSYARKLRGDRGQPIVQFRTNVIRAQSFCAT